MVKKKLVFPEKNRSSILIKYIRATTLSDQDFSEFDPYFYFLYYDDAINCKDIHELRNHYDKYTKIENRYGSAHQLLKDTDAKPLDLPKDFDPKEYHTKNFDLRLYENKPENYAIEHFLKIGRKENRAYKIPYTDKNQYDLNKKNIKNGKIAVLVHVYYIDILHELNEYIDSLKNTNFDIYYNIVESVYTAKVENMIKNRHPNARVVISPNKGQDIGGLIYLLRQISFTNYDFFCILHTKKSTHLDQKFSTRWRRNLCNALLKNTNKADENVALMLNNSDIGMIASGAHHSTGIADNIDHFNTLIKKLKIKKSAQSCCFVAGTMMMIKPKILQPLLDVVDPDQMIDCNTLEKKHLTDGTPAHAIERIIGNLVRNSGHTIFWQTEE